MSQKTHEIKLSPSISPHDVSYRVKWAEKWLGKGDKVKCTLNFKGRENLHKELGYSTLQDFIKELKPISENESGIKANGKSIYCVLRPISKKPKNEILR